MFPPIPDHCYASMRTIHKQNKSIMNEAFHSSPFLGCTVLPVCGDILECELLQATAVSLFITKRWILLYLLTDLVNSHSYCHTILTLTPFLTVVVFLIIPAGSFTPSILHPHTITSFISFLSFAEIPAAKVVFRRQCSTGIWLSLLSRVWFRLRVLEILKVAETKPIFKSLRQDLEDDCYTGVGRYYILRVLLFC